MQETKTAYLSIGSNMGNRLNHLQQAVFQLNKQAGTVLATSYVYQSTSWGFESDDFLNACITLKTILKPKNLLEVLLKIEKELGRERNLDTGYASRTIDIDIIYYEKEVIATGFLQLPHPNMESRRFVLKPLCDIAPQFYHPILNKDTRNLLQECKDKNPVQKTYTLYTNRNDLFSSIHFMAIEGNIGAGKSTLAKKIASDFNAKLILERFADNPFLPKFYKDQSRYAFPLEMSFLADRYQQFTDDTSQPDLFKNFMVSDYDIFKSLIFAQITLAEDEFSLYRKMFDFMYREVTKPSVYIYLYQNTSRLLENIKKRGRAYEQDISVDYLEKINKGYLNFIKSHPQQKSLIIDVSELDFVAQSKDYETVLVKIQEFVINSNH